MSLWLSLLGATALAAGDPPHAAGLPASSVPRISGWVRDPRLSELSGLAPSRRTPGRLWAINDSGSPAELIALGSDGVVQGIVKVLDAPNRDWEELSSYRADGKSWLVVADSGDNYARHPDHTLYFFREPSRSTGNISPKRRLRYRYTEGRLDSEALSIDAKAGLIYVISKRIRPSIVFSLPLDGDERQVHIAQRVGVLGGVLEPTAEQTRHNTNFLRYASEPTAMDLSCDGRTMAVLTYSRVYFYRREPGAPWSAALAKPVDSITLPPLPQAEALSYSHDCTRVLVGSEQPPTPLLAYPVQP